MWHVSFRSSQTSGTQNYFCLHGFPQKHTSSFIIHVHNTSKESCITTIGFLLCHCQNDKTWVDLLLVKGTQILFCLKHIYNRDSIETALLASWIFNPTSASTLHIYRTHDDVIKWKHFPQYWPFVRGIHRSPVNSPHKGQWRRALMFSLVCVWIKSWVNIREAGDLRRYRAHYDVIVM